MSVTREYLIGFETEFEVTRCGDFKLAIEVVDKATGQSQLLDPMEYFKYDKSHPDYIARLDARSDVSAPQDDMDLESETELQELSSIYDVEIFSIWLLDSKGQKVANMPPIFDAVFDGIELAKSAEAGAAAQDDSDKDEIAQEYKSLPEFRTEPLNLYSLGTKLHIRNYVFFLESLVKYVNSFPAEIKTVDLREWVRSFKEEKIMGAGRFSYRFNNPADGLEPDPEQISDAKVVLVKPDSREVFKPTIGLHANVGMPLCALYTPEIFRSGLFQYGCYPEKTEHGCKEWPGHDLPESYIKFSQSLIENINASVFNFLNRKLPDTTLHQDKIDIAGVLRALSYVACMSVYLDSELLELHFPKEKYNHDYPKSFFVFGLPKFDLCQLVSFLAEKQKELFRHYILTKEELDTRLPTSIQGVLINAGDLKEIMKLFSAPIASLIPRATNFNINDLTTNEPVKVQIEYYITQCLYYPLHGLPHREKQAKFSCHVSKIIDNDLVVEFRSIAGDGCYIDELATVMCNAVEAAKNLLTRMPKQEEVNKIHEVRPVISGLLKKSQCISLLPAPAPRIIRMDSASLQHAPPAKRLAPTMSTCSSSIAASFASTAAPASAFSMPTALTPSLGAVDISSPLTTHALSAVSSVVSLSPGLCGKCPWVQAAQPRGLDVKCQHTLAKKFAPMPPSRATVRRARRCVPIDAKPARSAFIAQATVTAVDADRVIVPVTAARETTAFKRRGSLLPDPQGYRPSKDGLPTHATPKVTRR